MEGKEVAVIVAGRSDASHLLLVLAKKMKPFMPPDGSQGPNAAEVAVLKAWIESGAKGPAGTAPDPTQLLTPKVSTVGQVRTPIHSVAWSPDGQSIAVARYGELEIRVRPDRESARTLAGPDRVAAKLLRRLGGISGHVNEVGYTRDGSTLFAAAGEPGLFGELRLFNAVNGQLIRKFRGHRDSIYAAAISPDGNTLATGSYDHQVKLLGRRHGSRNCDP